MRIKRADPELLRFVAFRLAGNLVCHQPGHPEERCRLCDPAEPEIVAQHAWNDALSLLRYSRDFRARFRDATKGAARLAMKRSGSRLVFSPQFLTLSDDHRQMLIESRFFKTVA